MLAIGVTPVGQHQFLLHSGRKGTRPEEKMLWLYFYLRVCILFPRPEEQVLGRALCHVLKNLEVCSEMWELGKKIAVIKANGWCPSK